ncbi:MAG: cytochrome c peroxidase [Planctomycetota bacterium]
MKQMLTQAIRCFAGIVIAIPVACAEPDRTSERLRPEPVPHGRALHLPATPDNYSRVPWPAHFASVVERFDNTPSDNPITDEGATLGRVLFYDPSLSIDGTVSCSSCHKQELGFTDDRALSVGIDGQQVDRNSMSLVNARFYQRGRFFWDERARTLEQQVLMPIENEKEMGHSLDRLEIQLSHDPLYPPLFEAAFGDADVTRGRISQALAQFIRSIVSFRSKYDVGAAQVQRIDRDFPNFTPEENLGKRVFLGRGNCASCHLSNALPFNPNRPDDPVRRGPRQIAFFTMSRPAVNGIDADVPEADPGVGGANGGDLDRGAFKSPSLRNLAVTGPYMHDGRFATIDRVIEHYNWSVRPHPNLDGRVRFMVDGIALPEPQKVALAAFLETLTDHELLSDPKFSNPFQEP